MPTGICNNCGSEFEYDERYNDEPPLCEGCSESKSLGHIETKPRKGSDLDRL